MSKLVKKSSKQSDEPIFVGIDLAWSNRNPTGCAIIRNNRLIAYTGDLGDNYEIVAFIREHLQENSSAVIGVDAPLQVPNATGSRLCDRTLSAEWRQFQAGALPANRAIFAKMNAHTEPNPDGINRLLDLNNQRKKKKGKESTASKPTNNPVRGEELANLLSEHLRFSQAATIPHQAKGRHLCEIYPHPAHISLFNLDKTLKYKSRSGRPYEERWPEMERYQQYLRTLRWAEPALKRTKKLLTETDVRQLRGKAFKAYEDTLDAITCAYVVNYLWVHGPEYARSYGTVKDGHIIVPLTDEMKKRLEA